MPDTGDFVGGFDEARMLEQCFSIDDDNLPGTQGFRTDGAQVIDRDALLPTAVLLDQRADLLGPNTRAFGLATSGI